MFMVVVLSILAVLVLGVVFVKWYKRTKRKWGENG